MNGDNGFCPRCNLPFNVNGIKIGRVGLEVGKYWYSLLKQDADDRANVGDAGGDHLVGRSNTGGCDRDVQRSASGRARLNVFVRSDFRKTFGEQGGLFVLPIIE